MTGNKYDKRAGYLSLRVYIFLVPTSDGTDNPQWINRIINGRNSTAPPGTLSGGISSYSLTYNEATCVQSQ